ncbi:MAG: NFACT family protein [Lachnospiraceae bacterium]|jgi:predicted ribosome quality control (RQC) complex YloA/Tae2 family protein|nr:NFACT family protein [Lachnospiraceae bacterium]MCH4030390.1 NFACT family protein [Lachnospiraceae bacterium]MCH4069602.1 NFACT family protein [Lachnospiraceae bacterium]MCH4107462.1 NFACT family protein [Lachnospiraceae bacterium]MCI1301687.1 NFACT family protein [Lachnospiraceae bacterium]
MAFDGTMTAAVRCELSSRLTGARLARIAQTESDELLLTFKTNNQYDNDGHLTAKADTVRVQLSVNASLPLVRILDENKPSPEQAPAFCMLLRKKIGNGRLTQISQPGMDRVLIFSFEHLDEMGDLKIIRLNAEFMGKYSNLILTDDTGTIIDAIKRIPASVSSVREVLPGRPYFVPGENDKLNPLTLTQSDFEARVFSQPLPLSKAIVASVTGFSPMLADEIAFEAGADGARPASALDDAEKEAVFAAFAGMAARIREEDFHPMLYRRDGEDFAYAILPMRMYEGLEAEAFDSPSTLLSRYYASRDRRDRMRQKTSDLRHIVTTLLERTGKKLAIQEKQLESTAKRDRYRMFGELLQAYSYALTDGAESAEVENYYDNNRKIRIPLDKSKTIQENASHYFERYNKLKRTWEADSKLIQESREQLEHLESILVSLSAAETESDIAAVRRELADSGYIHARANKKDRPGKSLPMHFVSSDGFDIYVGKNNQQNEMLTFKTAAPSDWWFHAKKMPGSHVIVRAQGKELPDATFEEAARLAAHFSKAQDSPSAEVDYVRKKEVKKPPAAKPGFVIYYTNYSMVASTNIDGIRRVE